MDAVLRDRPNINPPLVINQRTAFESDSVSSQQLTSKDDDDPVIEPDGDPFVPGAVHRAKKRKVGNNKAVDRVLDALQEKWEDDRATEQTTCGLDQTFREEESKKGDRLVTIIEKGMNDTVDILRQIMNKM
jgi:hypothetical protein